MANGNREFGVVCKPNTVTYNTIIDGLCKEGFVDKAKELFLQMKDENINPNVVTYNSLIHGFTAQFKFLPLQILKGYLYVFSVITFLHDATFFQIDRMWYMEILFDDIGKTRSNMKWSILNKYLAHCRR